jgi:hypothetical protein
VFPDQIYIPAGADYYSTSSDYPIQYHKAVFSVPPLPCPLRRFSSLELEWSPRSTRHTTETKATRFSIPRQALKFMKEYLVERVGEGADARSQREAELLLDILRRYAARDITRRGIYCLLLLCCFLRHSRLIPVLDDSSPTGATMGSSFPQQVTGRSHGRTPQSELSQNRPAIHPVPSGQYTTSLASSTPSPITCNSSSTGITATSSPNSKQASIHPAVARSTNQLPPLGSDWQTPEQPGRQRQC